MNKTTKHIPSAAVFLAVALLHCSQASAATVTYNFDEAGWVNNAGTTEDFFGTFTGTPEGTGVLALTDLTGFMATLTETNPQNETKTIDTFSSATQFLFDPTANTLTLATTGTPGALICLGDTVAEGVCGPVGPRPVNRDGVPAPPLEGLFISSVNGDLSASTIDLATITLVQPLIIPGQGTAPDPTQIPSPTPEPASLFLCATGLLVAGLARRTTGLFSGNFR